MRSISQRDLDALRAGIREQERRTWEEEQYRTDYDRRLARVRPDTKNVLLLDARDLRAGDVLLSAEGGDRFYKYETLTRVVPDERGSVWIEWGDLNEPNAVASNLAGSFVAGKGGGRRVRESDIVLVERPSS